MSKVNLYTAEFSRRNLLIRATGAALVATSTCAFAKAKRTQADVAYQDRPKGDEQCDNCEPFIAPNACKTVEGTVSAKGWCKIYVAK